MLLFLPVYSHGKQNDSSRYSSSVNLSLWCRILSCKGISGGLGQGKGNRSVPWSFRSKLLCATSSGARDAHAWENRTQRNRARPFPPFLPFSSRLLISGCSIWEEGNRKTFSPCSFLLKQVSQLSRGLRTVVPCISAVGRWHLRAEQAVSHKIHIFLTKKTKAWKQLPGHEAARLSVISELIPSFNKASCQSLEIEHWIETHSSKQDTTQLRVTLWTTTTKGTWQVCNILKNWALLSTLSTESHLLYLIQTSSLTCALIRARSTSHREHTHSSPLTSRQCNDIVQKGRVREDICFWMDPRSCWLPPTTQREHWKESLHPCYAQNFLQLTTSVPLRSSIMTSFFPSKVANCCFKSTSKIAFSEWKLESLGQRSKALLTQGWWLTGIALK